MFKKFFSFEGRIRRTEYGLSYLFFITYAVVFSLLIDVNVKDGSANSLILLLIAIPGYWFMFAQGSKRCHDRGNSGWYQLIPFYGLWMLFADSDFGPNQYGPNPKGLGNNDDIDEIGSHLK